MSEHAEQIAGVCRGWRLMPYSRGLSVRRRARLALGRRRQPSAAVQERCVLAALGYARWCRRGIDVAPYTPERRS